MGLDPGSLATRFEPTGGWGGPVITEGPSTKGPMALGSCRWRRHCLGMPKHRQPGEPIETSESEEMYLITVARAAEDGESTPIPMGYIAKRLSVSVPSAHEMVHRLVERGLLNYEPYHGVDLTEAGGDVADRVLRTRRLWATFLSEHLGFSPEEADDQACEFEHVTTDEAARRLASFLGNPESGPLGNPIPSGELA